jgi:excisionase family DNA binding protein
MSQCSTGNPPDSHGPLMTAREVCDFARCGRTFLYAECAAGHLRIFKLGASTRFKRQDVEMWLSARLIPVGQDVA